MKIKGIAQVFVVSALALLFASEGLAAQTDTLLNYPRLYRGARTAAMGGAYTAVGGDVEALFYNPATLYKMDFQLNLINPLVDVNENALDIYQDAADAMDVDNETDRLNKITEIIQKNMGKPLHVRAALFPGFAVKNYAFGVLGQVEFDTRLHNPLGSAGAVEMDGGYEYGPVAGFSLPTGIGGLRAGLGAKLISRSWVKRNFTVREIASENFDMNDYTTENSDFSLDAGLLYELPVMESLKPKIGVSVLDITDLDFKEGGKIPMRANIGLSVNPKVPFLGDVILAADYEDVTNEFAEDKSTWKRVHLGAELGLLKRHLLLRGGVNQGYGTFGAELDIWVIKLAYTYYAEEIGAYAGQEMDKRQMASLTIGW
ncbi:MAG: hypothetical protein Q8J64_03585 [Thermodesulfovibrionales bacterium]|nr:hypothetical protein [Thermodesulfovibrionales bacterium]